MKLDFCEVFDDYTSRCRKIPKEEYLSNGKYIVIDQGQNNIAGYTNIDDGLFEDVPAIVFGDHTRIIKYVDEPFFLGADGVKLLKSKIEDANYKYLYYVLRNARIPDTGYNRHFKWLKEINLEYKDAESQKNIVKTLDTVTNIIELYKVELSKLDNLIRARFVEMFGDVKANPYGFEKMALKDTCTVITGNTPSRSVPEYYGDSIEWIKTDNIVSGQLRPSQALEYLSDEGMKVGRTVEKGAILMACIAGSVASIGRVCITDRKVAFNQQINAIVSEDYDSLFLHTMLQLSKEYLAEEINMALKGILSKSKLEGKEFIVPSIEQQKQFATFVAQVNKSKVEVQRALDEAQLLFDSLMQKYFG
ncbi:restriction endonuclease subunit S [Lachnoanaerobaculum sp. Marseille-Q4761]|uniref:restriction endonuclease subunit S n=1 Tax=Lachnoanaerobaculum sp. Marseille-Q4761 TaxID=2819511 RepID=UPI001AA13694|nr:restriction endonuclease subunit S [Lachnoanaerobaculum sp. Marseille-Q4761]MBO1872042.1 restriction endonuclease subunit S [Lachnoanaerobaculum sp. Marseille-Q4761]